MSRPSKRALDKLRAMAVEQEAPVVEVRHVTLTFPDSCVTPKPSATESPTAPPAPEAATAASAPDAPGFRANAPGRRERIRSEPEAP